MKKIVNWVRSRTSRPAIQARQATLDDEMSRLEDYAMQFVHAAEGQLGTDSELSELFHSIAEAVFDYRAAALALWRHEEDRTVPSIDNVAVMPGAVCPSNASPAKKVQMFFVWAKGTRQLAASFTECDERNMRKALTSIADAYVRLGLAFASRLGISVTAEPVRDEELIGALA